MKIHVVKIESFYFEPLINHSKTAEVRYNDRNYQVGDILQLNEFDTRGFTGRVTQRTITHVLAGFVGLAPGYVCLSLSL